MCPREQTEFVRMLMRAHSRSSELTSNVAQCSLVIYNRLDWLYNRPFSKNVFAGLKKIKIQQMTNNTVINFNIHLGFVLHWVNNKHPTKQ
ncbi:hypothetical protein QTP88_007581 [Uroleucon formosanum]